MSSRDKIPHDIDLETTKSVDESKPIELRKKPDLSVTWEKAKEMFNLE